MCTDIGKFVKIAVMPALNEVENVRNTVLGILPFVDKVIVVDNASTDGTAAAAQEAGAIVVLQPKRGYGASCLAGMAHAQKLGAKIIVFLDADGSEDPLDAPQLISAVESNSVDLSLGVRDRAMQEAGSMTSVQKFGNWLAPALMRTIVGAKYQDMPPFKVIRTEALNRLQLTDEGHGFTIEFLLEAHRVQLRTAEFKVHSRARKYGVSKVSGTLKGSSRAAVKILSTIGKYAWLRGVGPFAFRKTRER